MSQSKKTKLVIATEKIIEANIQAGNHIIRAHATDASISGTRFAEEEHFEAF